MTAKEMIDCRAGFRDFLMEPRPNPLKYYLLDIRALIDLTELWGTELSRAVGLDGLSDDKSSAKDRRTNLRCECGQTRRIFAGLATALRSWFWLLSF